MGKVVKNGRNALRNLSRGVKSHTKQRSAKNADT